MVCLMSKFTLGKKKRLFAPTNFSSTTGQDTHDKIGLGRGVERGNVRVKYLAQEDDAE